MNNKLVDIEINKENYEKSFDIYKYSILNRIIETDLTRFSLNSLSKKEYFENEFEAIFYTLFFIDYILKFENNKNFLSKEFLEENSSNYLFSLKIFEFFKNKINKQKIDQDLIENLNTILHIYSNYLFSLYFIINQLSETDKIYKIYIYALNQSSFHIKINKINQILFIKSLSITISSLLKNNHILKNNFNIFLNEENIKSHLSKINGTFLKKETTFQQTQRLLGFRKLFNWYDFDYTNLNILPEKNIIQKKNQNSVDLMVDFITNKLHHSSLVKYYIYKTIFSLHNERNTLPLPINEEIKGLYNIFEENNKFILRETNYINRKDLYDNYVGLFLTFENFCQVLYRNVLPIKLFYNCLLICKKLKKNQELAYNNRKK